MGPASATRAARRLKHSDASVTEGPVSVRLCPLPRLQDQGNASAMDSRFHMVQRALRKSARPLSPPLRRRSLHSPKPLWTPLTSARAWLLLCEEMARQTGLTGLNTGALRVGLRSPHGCRDRLRVLEARFRPQITRTWFSSGKHLSKHPKQVPPEFEKAPLLGTVVSLQGSWVTMRSDEHGDKSGKSQRTAAGHGHTGRWTACCGSGSSPCPGSTCGHAHQGSHHLP